MLELSMPSARVIQSLVRTIEWRGKAAAIRCNNGPEYVSNQLVEWANYQRTSLLYIHPGKPMQNAYHM